jgi:hypothetical protein
MGLLPCSVCIIMVLSTAVIITPLTASCRQLDRHNERRKNRKARARGGLTAAHGGDSGSDNDSDDSTSRPAATTQQRAGSVERGTGTGAVVMEGALANLLQCSSLQRGSGGSSAGLMQPHTAEEMTLDGQCTAAPSNTVQRQLSPAAPAQLPPVQPQHQQQQQQEEEEDTRRPLTPFQEQLLAMGIMDDDMDLKLVQQHRAGVAGVAEAAAVPAAVAAGERVKGAAQPTRSRSEGTVEVGDQGFDALCEKLLGAADGVDGADSVAAAAIRMVSMWSEQEQQQQQQEGAERAAHSGCGSKDVHGGARTAQQQQQPHHQPGDPVSADSSVHGPVPPTGSAAAATAAAAGNDINRVLDMLNDSDVFDVVRADEQPLLRGINAGGNSRSMFAGAQRQVSAPCNHHNNTPNRPLQNTDQAGTPFHPAAATEQPTHSSAVNCVVEVAHDASFHSGSGMHWEHSLQQQQQGAGAMAASAPSVPLHPLLASLPAVPTPATFSDMPAVTTAPVPVPPRFPNILATPVPPPSLSPPVQRAHMLHQAWSSAVATAAVGADLNGAPAAPPHAYPPVPHHPAAASNDTASLSRKLNQV